MSDFKDKKVAINTPFMQEKSVTQRGNMIQTVDGSMQLIHADVADLIFFSKSAVTALYVCRLVHVKNLHVHHEKEESPTF